MKSEKKPLPTVSYDCRWQGEQTGNPLCVPMQQLNLNIAADMQSSHADGRCHQQ